MQNHLSIDDTRETLVKDVNALKRDAVQIAQDVKTHAHTHVDQAKRQVASTAQDLQDALTSHPFALLGAGLVIGFFFGFRLRH